MSELMLVRRQRAWDRRAAQSPSSRLCVETPPPHQRAGGDQVGGREVFVAGPPAESAGSYLFRSTEVRPVPNVPQPPLFAPLSGLSFWLKKAGKNNTIHQILEQV